MIQLGSLFGSETRSELILFHAKALSLVPFCIRLDLRICIFFLDILIEDTLSHEIMSPVIWQVVQWTLSFWTTLSSPANAKDHGTLLTGVVLLSRNWLALIQTSWMTWQTNVLRLCSATSTSMETTLLDSLPTSAARGNWALHAPHYRHQLWPMIQTGFIPHPLHPNC